MKTRILLVDDHEIVRRGLKMLINQNPDWEVCGEAANGKEAVEKTIALNPEIIVMDVMMPVLNGLDATTRIRKLAPAVKVVLLSVCDARQLAALASSAGAHAFLVKTCTAIELRDVIERVVGPATAEALGQ